MKIRGRLIIAFLIITIFPLLLMSVCTNLILTNQTEILENSYQTETSTTNFIFNPLQVLYSMTMTDYNELVFTADHSPDTFSNPTYLSQVNDTLQNRDSFLVVRKNHKEIFIGNTDVYNNLETLAGFSEYHEGSNNTISINPSIPCLIKQKDFLFSDKSRGQIFLITDLTRIMPAWEYSFKQLIFSLMVIITATACLLVFWIYNSIVKPLNVLRIATMHIGAGQLDMPVRVHSTDEIGELCRDFEEMRIRLKEMIEERIRYEQNTRDMISSMAHDLQTPLTSIKGYTEGILDGVANTPQKQTKYLQTIYAKASDMSYLVDELSIFAKIEQNTLPYHFIPLNLHEYFEDCMNEFSLDLESKEITIKYDNSCRPATKVLADPEQLKRVIQNIIGNAVKYHDKTPGMIHIIIQDVPLPEVVPPLYRQLDKNGTPIEPEAPKMQEYVQICIRDNGPGIEANDLPYIFHRFFRADASRNSSKGGSGLGLAIVAKIIEDHGGRVWAESIPQEGTSIFFTLRKERTDTHGKNIDY